MAKMFATTLNLDTEACQSESVESRKHRFEEALRQVNAVIAKKMGPTDQGRAVWNVFAAPEYSFANPIDHDNHGPGDVRHLSEGAKVDIEAWLKGLSVQYPRTLIFPGSIAWKKSLTRDLNTYLTNKRAVYGLQMGANRKFAAKTETRQQKAVGSINNQAAQFMGGNLNAKVSGDMRKLSDWGTDTNGVEWFEAINGKGVLGWKGKYWTSDIKDAKYIVRHAAPTNQGKLNELGGGNVTHMARNTSLIYLNGKKQAKYHKAQDYHEVLDGSGDTVYVPGNSIPTFSADGKVFGVELCLDHVFGSLRNPQRLRGKNPDIIVLMSAKVRFDANKLPNPGAMVIHACSNQTWSFVGRGGVADAGCTKEAVTLFGQHRSNSEAFSLYSFDV